MKKNKLLALVALATVAFLGLTGFRHAGGPHDPERMQAFLDKRIERALDEIEATDAQRAQIEQIKERFVAQMQAQQGQRGEMRQEFLSFWKEENPDAAAVRSRIDQRIEQHRARAYQMADAMLEVHAVLTPEQRAELAQLMEKRAGRMEKRGKRFEKRGDQAQQQQ